MRLLTNFPFEMFGERDEFPFEQIVTFGPPEGRRVGADVFRYDIPFDASRATIEDLLVACPAGFVPDAIMLWWPDQEPIPDGLERAPMPVVATISDYNLTLPHVRRLWPLVDLVLCDTPGLQVLGRLPFARVEPWCQFSFRPDVHRIYANEDGTVPERDIDICFAGNLDPTIQRTRAPYIARLAALANRHKVVLTTTAQGEPYGRLLARSKIVFNRSIRGEINLRAFEAPACGALLLVERENTEIRDYFEPDHEVVLYAPGDLEATIEALLADEERRSAIAARGHAKVQDYRLASHCRALPDLIRTLDPRTRPRAPQRTRLLGRAASLLSGWAAGTAALEALTHACKLGPPATGPHTSDAEAPNDLAVALLRLTPERVETAHRLLLQARARDPEHIPTQLNLAWLYARARRPSDLARSLDATRALLQKSTPAHAWSGLCAPLGWNEDALGLAAAQCETLRLEHMDPMLQWFRDRCDRLEQGQPFGSITKQTVACE